VTEEQYRALLTRIRVVIALLVLVLIVQTLLAFGTFVITPD
jgi:hypothetical protein